ncbi:hypothetical protein IM40_10485 (plasmid) [Candidatus Paracaedimonas acanthamoebae]|nr:hypothetical protein IM40_10485 [Candidatus Paracaedimonas acanthamoebae]
MGQKPKGSALLFIINSLIVLLLHPFPSLSKEIDDKQERREKALETSESLRNLDRLRKQNAALLQQNLDLNKTQTVLYMIIKRQAELIDQLTKQNKQTIPQAQQIKESSSLTMRASSQKTSLFDLHMLSLQKINISQQKTNKEPLNSIFSFPPQTETSSLINEDLYFPSKIISILKPETIKQQDIISFVPSSLRQENMVVNKDVPTISTHNQQEQISIEPIAPHKSNQHHETLKSNEQPLFTIEKEAATLVEESVPASSLSVSKVSMIDKQQHAHLTARLQELEQQNYALEQELSHRQSVEQDFFSLQTHHEDLQRELGTLKSRLETVQEQDENQALQQTKTAVTSLTKTEQSVNTLQEGADPSKENELEQRIHELQVALDTHVNKLKKFNHTTRENVELHEQRMMELTQELDLAKQKISQKKNHTKKLKNCLTNFKQENLYLKERQATPVTTIDASQQENSELEQLIRELFEKLRILESDKQALEAINKTLERTIQISESNEEALCHTGRRNAEKQSTFMPQVSVFSNSEIPQEEKEEAETSHFLESRLLNPIPDDPAKEQAYQERLEELNKRIDELSQQLSHGQAILWSTQDKNAKKEAELSELTAKLKRIIKENSELKRQNYQLKNEKAELEQSGKALNELIRTKDRTLSKFEEKVKKYEKDRIASQDDVSKLYLLLEDLSKQLKKQTTNMKQLKAENHKLSQRNTNLIQKQDESDAYIRDISSVLENKIIEVRKLKERTETLEEKFNQALAFSHELEDNLKECIATLQMFYVATVITKQRINNQQENLDSIRYVASQWVQEYGHSSENAIEYINQFIECVRSGIHPDNERDDQPFTNLTTTRPNNTEDDLLDTLRTAPSSSISAHNRPDKEAEAG